MAELGWLGILVPERYGGLGLGLARDGDRRAGARARADPGAADGDGGAGGDRACRRGQRSAEARRVAAPRRRRVAARAGVAGSRRACSTPPRSNPGRRRSRAAIKLSGAKRFIAGAAQADAFLVSAQAGRRHRAAVAAARRRRARNCELEPLADGRSFGTLRLQDALVPQGTRGGGRRGRGGGARPRVRPWQRDRGRRARGRDGARARDEPRLPQDARAVRQADRRFPGAAAPRGGPATSRRSWQARCSRKRSPRSTAAPTPRPARALASRVKARCADAALKITREAIQLHGAIGFTDEYDAGLYLKRAMTLAAWLGHPALASPPLRAARPRECTA